MMWLGCDKVWLWCGCSLSDWAFSNKRCTLIYIYHGHIRTHPSYWQDAHYPASQSAQVVRLDCRTCAWQVDLDTGESTGVTHMKGNILHEVTFTTDSTGAALSRNVSLLVAASKADSSPEGGSAISVFVRQDVGVSTKNGTDNNQSTSSEFMNVRNRECYQRLKPAFFHPRCRVRV